MREFFPWDTPRPGQIEICEAIKQQYDSGVKFVILQAPTGTGKSVLSYTIANSLQHEEQQTYILTSQKSLQDQYVADFSDVKTVKGAANFTCDINGNTCDVGECKTKKGIDCHCPYKIQRDEAYRSNITLLNYAYFLNMSLNGSFQEPRELLICDECHNMESQLIMFSELEINYTSYKHHNLKPPKLPPSSASEEDVISWVSDILVPELYAMKHTLTVELEMESVDNDEDAKQSISTLKALSFVKTQLRRAERVQPDTQWSIQNKDGFNMYIKPLFVNDVAKELVFDDFQKVLLMSATVLDPTQFCKDLGITVEEAAFIDLPSNFPIQNRPIFDVSSVIGPINYKTMDIVKPKIVKTIEQLLALHTGEMGIIHVPSYDLAQYIVDNVDTNRLVLPKGASKEKVIKKFTDNKFKDKDKVLISPSLSEGIDLKGDLGKFSIICKAPFASLGDPFIKKRSTMDSQWYQIETLRKFIQSCGRITRSADDITATYILDPAIYNLMIRNRRFVPDWFFNSIQKK
jgi:ATP-dependent DNA helicase DinG